jgi:predicted glutamine amidotransferase
MCGIFGVFIKRESAYKSEFVNDVLKNIAVFSQARGKDSSGLAFVDYSNYKLTVFKGAISISGLLRSKELHDFIESDHMSSLVEKGYPYAAIGHARLVTNGSQLQNINNQPVIKDSVIGIHNGIIVNVDKLWASETDLKRKYSIDTEIFLAMIRKSLKLGDCMEIAVSKAIKKVKGTVSSAMLFDDRNQAVLATNNGSLYLLQNQKDFIVFASEEYFLTRLSTKVNLHKHIGNFTIEQVKSGDGFIIDLETHQIEKFSQDHPHSIEYTSVNRRKLTVTVNEINGNQQNEVVLDISKIYLNSKAQYESALLEHNSEQISKIRRCTKCLLPETFPFIEFNKEGVCNYCTNHKPKNLPKPISGLIELVEPYRNKTGKPSCIVPFSGGRDSTFTLHHVKRTLNMNPIAFTYDWGMVTDLARRNIARVCGELGVENIIVSADIHRKRKNIKQNILAWLKHPDLGLVPLFMAGDKYFFYFTEQLKKQTGINLNIWGINSLENTDFKVGFCGVKPDFDKKRIYSLSALSKVKLIKHIAKNLIANPSYFNSSVLDTIGSFISRYKFENKDYYHFYDYYSWNEQEIEKLLFEKYDWETAVDTKTTWRIGDGTAGFYNYIYYNVAGFSEYDTFRSNQIREGMLTRGEGMKMIEDENRPRYASVKWYTEIVGLDFETTIKAINKIPKLYK